MVQRISVSGEKRLLTTKHVVNVMDLCYLFYSTRYSCLFAEVVDGFGIIPPTQEKVTPGDDVVMTCVAPIHNYTNEIRWMDGNQVDITDTDRISVNHTQSEHTYQAILRINSVNKTDGRSYTCRAVMVPDANVEVDYHLRVYGDYLQSLMI